MGMTLSDIKYKIGRRVSDPNLDTYSDATEDYFEQALATLVQKRKENSILPYYANEILPLMETKEIEVDTNSLNYGTININNNDYPGIMFVYSVDNHIPTNIVRSFFYMSPLEFNNLTKNNEVCPPQTHGYWTINGDSLKIYINQTDDVDVKYIKNPDPDNWGEDDLVNDIGFGFSLIADCIELASSLLRRQVGLEG